MQQSNSSTDHHTPRSEPCPHWHLFSPRYQTVYHGYDAISTFLWEIGYRNRMNGTLPVDRRALKRLIRQGMPVGQDHHGRPVAWGPALLMWLAMDHQKGFAEGRIPRFPR